MRPHAMPCLEGEVRRLQLERARREHAEQRQPPGGAPLDEHLEGAAAAVGEARGHLELRHLQEGGAMLPIGLVVLSPCEDADARPHAPRVSTLRAGHASLNSHHVLYARTEIIFCCAVLAAKKIDCRMGARSTKPLLSSPVSSPAFLRIARVASSYLERHPYDGGAHEDASSYICSDI